MGHEGPDRRGASVKSSAEVDTRFCFQHHPKRCDITTSSRTDHGVAHCGTTRKALVTHRDSRCIRRSTLRAWPSSVGPAWVRAALPAQAARHPGEAATAVSTTGQPWRRRFLLGGEALASAARACSAIEPGRALRSNGPWRWRYSPSSTWSSWSPWCSSSLAWRGTAYIAEHLWRPHGAVKPGFPVDTEEPFHRRR
jgi:hypothetical protein